MGFKSEKEGATSRGFAVATTTTLATTMATSGPELPYHCTPDNLI
jgi:hypothetical protein